MNIPALTCQTCSKWSPKNAGQMAQYGYGTCAATATPWMFLPPNHGCSNHLQALPDVVKTRAAWLEKKFGRAG